MPIARPRYTPGQIGHQIAIACLLATLFLQCDLAVANDSEANALAERMLERLGGRSAWAELENTVNGSQQNRTGEPTVVYAVISMDFQQPRFRIETTGPDLHLAGHGEITTG